MASSNTRASLNRKVRQEALRDQLQAQGHVQHVVEILDNLRNEEHKLADDMLPRLKLVVDTKLKLIGKYLPDLKQTEIEGTIDIVAHESWLDKLDE